MTPTTGFSYKSFSRRSAQRAHSAWPQLDTLGSGPDFQEGAVCVASGPRMGQDGMGREPAEGKAKVRTRTVPKHAPTAPRARPLLSASPPPSSASELQADRMQDAGCDTPSPCLKEPSLE